MAKKNSTEAFPDSSENSTSTSTGISSTPCSTSKSKTSKTPQPSISALIICRNKHWRYISSFHGPWLQLPPEVLECLANNNYNLPRPRPIDPAVFFDLLKIRQLVDDATNLAVRAASGVTSSSLTNSLNAGNGLLGNGVAALGLGLGGGGNAKLSRERKHRMREQATQKLSKAYHLDEIACSVATMQAASTLEDVAHLVLQRNPHDVDAKYVHFFHEKIPSRQLAECTTLQPLDEIIAERSGEGETLRTRAVTKMFKDNFTGAAQDLTSALQTCRYYQSQHKAGRQQLQLASEASAEGQRSSRWKEMIKLDEADHPSSLETQLLFHRAGVYLTIACQSVEDSLPLKSFQKGTISTRSEPTNGGMKSVGEGLAMAEKEAQRKRLEARNIVKTNAKRALRDYLSYLSHFDYTPGLPSEITEEFIRNVNQAANGFKIPRPQNHGKTLDNIGNDSLCSSQLLSDALIPHHHSHCSRPSSIGLPGTTVPTRSSPVVYSMSALFSATPPSDLPPYPETASLLTSKQQFRATQNDATKAILAQADCHEALTYHPLLTDALHSLLLCHCLIQTSARELKRHAYMVARLARVCDGYPIFQAARSPSRADWIEVLRRGDNWIQLCSSWETLCAPAPLPGQAVPTPKETPAEKRDRLKHEAVMEALEDDRVHDEASFHAAVAARQRRQEEDARKADGREFPKRWAQEDGKEYPISTERAHAIVRWVKEAPLGGDAGDSKKKKRAGKTVGKGNCKNGIDVKVGVMNFGGKNFKPFEGVEQEVD